MSDRVKIASYIIKIEARKVQLDYLESRPI